LIGFMYEEYCITMIRLQAKDEGTVVILDNICKERKPFNSLSKSSKSTKGFTLVKENPFIRAIDTKKKTVPYCTENPIYVFPEMKLRGLVPNSYIHVSVKKLYIPRIGLPILLCLPICLQQDRQTDPGDGWLSRGMGG
jgi:hypothetical protein